MASALLGLLGLVCPAHGRTDEALVEARGWLVGQQNADGSFGTGGDLLPRDSALAVEALTGGSPGPVIDRGADYLAALDEQVTHFRALRVHSLALTGRPFEPLLDSLVGLRNGSGFAAFAVHESNLLDTTLAIEAYAADERDRVLDIVPLIDYLLASQGADGGWAFLPNTPSQVYYTGETLWTLASLETLAISPQVIDRARSYLLANLRPDGTFGSVVETAVAYRALIASGYTPAAGQPDVVGALLAAQADDGSWDADVFTTAKVVLALGEELPNLRVTAFTANPANAPLGTPIVLTATVRNVGPAPAPASTLVVRSGAVDGLERASAPVGALAAGAQADVQVTLETGAESGNLTLFAVADGRFAVAERDESDNARSVVVGLRSGPDLALFAPNLAVSPSQPKPNIGFTLQVNAQNLGETAVPGFRWRVSRLVAGAPTSPVEGTVGAVAAGGALLFSVPLNLPEGEHVFAVELDPLDTIDEENENNNVAEIAFFVIDPARADFGFLATELTITPAQPAVGQTASVAVKVRNFGSKSGTALYELFDGDPAAGGTLIGSQSVTVGANGVSGTITRTFTVKPESVFLTAVVDRANVVPELDEANNRLRRVFRDLPDAAVGFDGFDLVPAAPQQGDPVQVTLTVRNAGTAAAADLAVEVFDGDPAAGGDSVFSTRVPALPAGGNRALSFTWPATGGLRRLVAVLDGDAEMVELLEDNNRAEREVAVPRAAGPDLTVAAVDASTLSQSPTTLQATGSVRVDVRNAGETTGATFAVRLFEDRDGDGRFSAGDQDLGSALVEGGLAGGADTATTIAVEAGLAFHRPLLFAEVDATDVVPERREDNNRATLFGTCEATPPSSVEPIEEWYLPGIEIQNTPVVVQLGDDNGDGAIDSRDTPDVVFHAVDAQGQLVLAVSGLDGTQQWAFRSTPANPLQGGKTNLSAADLDGDGVVEILAVQSNSRLVALDNTGALHWVSDPIESTGGDWRGGSAVGDLTGDGVPEIVVGRAVLSNTGKRIAIGTANAGRNYNYYGPLGSPYLYDQQHSIVADVDLDGRAELVAGDTVYRLVDGVLTVVWDHAEHDNMLKDGFSAVGNLDADPFPEIVYVSAGFVMVLNHDGSTRTPYRRLVNVVPPINENTVITFWGGPPTIADLTGDGVPEILVATDSELLAMRANLSTLWRRPTFDYAGMTAATAFDLDGDGDREVIYNDENNFFILEGSTGAVLHQRKNTSLTGTEYPLVADVDNDGQAEIVVPSSRHRSGDRTTQGLHVFGNPSWRGTRTIWNQHSYHVGNVRLDGTVPAQEPPSWQTTNTYRTNLELPRRSRRLPNLTLGLPIVAAATPQGIPVTVRVGNGGLGSLPAGVRVRLYDTNPAAGPANAFGEASTTAALAPGSFEDVTVLWQAPGEAPRSAFAAADPDGAHAECDEGDNVLELLLTETLLSDLFVPPGGVTAPATVAAGQPVTVSVQVRNVGAASSAPTVIRLYDGDPGLGQVLGEAPLAALAPAGTVTVPVRWDTLGSSGTHAVHAVADATGAVPEADESNNEGLAMVQLTAPTLPDLSAEALQLSAAEVRPGEPVRATVTVKNRGTALPLGFGAALRVNGAQVGPVITSAGDLAAGASRDVELTLDTLGRSGVLGLEVRLDPQNVVSEQSETNNTSPRREVRVLAAETTLQLRADKSSYAPGETVAFTVTATSAAAEPRTVELRLLVLDSLGAEIALVASQPVTLAPGANTFALPWASGDSLPGAYVGVVEVREGGAVGARATAPFSIAREVKLQARLFADRDVYAPGQSAILTGAVINESVNTILQGLTLQIAVHGPSGAQVFAVEQPIAMITPGSTVRAGASWPIGTPAPGSYVASLGVRDSGGKLLAFGSTRVEVEDSAQSGAGLDGRITVTPAVVSAGAPVVVGYELTNRGNNDLPALPLRFDLVRVADAEVVDSQTRTRAVARNQTVTGSLGQPTADLVAGHYLVALVAVLPAGERRLAGELVVVMPGVSIGDAAVAEGDAGTTQAAFVVELSSPSVEPVTVAYATADGTAVAGSDYVVASGTVTFAPGEVEKPVTVDVVGDLDPELDELFLVELSAPVNAGLGDAQGLGSIADEEGCPGPNLLSNPGAELTTAAGELTGWVAAAESAWGPRFGEPAPLAGRAWFGTAAATAELRQDVDVSAYAARIDAGLQRFAFAGFVQSADEPAPDAARVLVEYRDAANAAVLAAFDSGELGEPGGWRGVVDERAAPAGTRWVRVRLLATRHSGETTDVGFDRLSLLSAGAPVLRVEDAEAVEGNAGTTPARFRVTLSCAAPAAIAVTYGTQAGSAVEGSDYDAAAGTLTFAAGDVEARVDVPVRGDTTDEADETFQLALQVPDSVVALDASGDGLIRDDDGPVAVSVDDVTVAEGDAGTTEAVFTLSLSAASGREVRVSYASVAGSAAAGADFQAASGTAVFAPGSTTASVAVAVVGDTLDEPQESFALHLSNPLHATVADADGEARIADDDEVFVSIDDVQVVEGDSGTVAAVFTVTLSVPSVHEVSVAYATADGNAVAPADYTAASGSLVFAPGTTSKTLNVLVKGELVKEPEETFFVRLSNPVAALLAKPEGIGTILDNDGSLISIGNATVRETDGGTVTATLNVTLSKAGTQTITVAYATADGTAAAGADYQAASGVVTFTPGQTSRPVTVTVLSDDVAEPLEKLAVRLSNETNASVLDDLGEVTVVDDDGWTLIGSASDVSTVAPAGCFLLTPATTGLKGAVWRNEPRDLRQSFDDTYRVFLGSLDSNGADGIVFTLQNAGLAAIGTGTGTGVGMGYAGLPGASVGVELDTWESGSTLDHIAVDENGAVTHNGHPSVQASAASINIEDAKEHLLRVTWNAPARQLTASFDGVQRLVYEKDVVAQLFGGAPQVYAGFTGGTGSVANVQYFCETEACYGSGGTPKLSIGDARVLEGDAGSVQARFAVTLSCPSDQQVTVAFTTVAGTAEAGSDFMPAAGTLTFAPGETSKTIDVDLVPDVRGEADETFFVDLSGALGAAVRYARGTATILSDEVTATIGDAAVSEGSSGTHVVRLPVTLGTAFRQAVAIPYATADGTAGAADYTAASGTLTFQPGETSKVLTVTVKGDVLPEGNESFFVRLQAADVVELVDGEAVVTLLDDDDCPSPNLLRNGGNEEALVDGNIPGWTEVLGTSWTRGTGSPTPLAGAAQFHAGSVALAELRQDVDVSAYAELIDAGTQRFSFEGFVQTLDQGENSDASRIVVEYRDAANAAVLASFDSGEIDQIGSWLRLSELRAAPVGTRRIRVRLISTLYVGGVNHGSYDQLSLVSLGIPAITVTGVSVTEGNAGTVPAAFPVKLSCPSSRSASVDYFTVDGTAAAGSDYQPVAGTLLFAPGETTKTVTVQVVGDTEGEPNESFLLQLANPVDAALAQAQATGTIVQDESVVSVGGTEVLEGNSGQVVASFPVTLSRASDQEIRVDYATEDGTATAGTDYTAASGTLIFLPGETSKTVPVTVRGDVEVEPDETFFVQLTNPVRVSLGTDRALGTVVQDDLSISIADSALIEGNSGTANMVFTVTLSTPSSETVTVQYSTQDGSAVAPADYTAVNTTTLSFSPGQTAKTIAVQVKGDTVVETSETFMVKLRNPVKAGLLVDEGLGTIADDDDCPSPNLLRNGSGDDALVGTEVPGWTEVGAGTLWTRRTATPSPVRGTAYFYAGAVAEGELRQDVDVSTYAPTIDVGIQRFFFEGFVQSANESPADTARVLVEYRAANDEGPALAVFDTGETAEVGAWRQVIDLRPAPPGTRSVRVRLLSRRVASTNAEANAYFDGLSLRTLGIPAVTIDDGARVREADSGPVDLAFTVRLTCPWTTPVRVDYSTTPGTAQAGVDYQPVQGTLTFAPGTTTLPVVVPVLPDLYDESEETLHLVLANEAAAAVVERQGVGTIADDDPPPAFRVRDVEVSEGNAGTTSAVFAVELSHPSFNVLTVDYRTVSGEAQAGSDYVTRTGELTFQPGEQSHTVAVTVNGDVTDEVDERFYLELLTPTNGGIADPVGVATIRDDDDDRTCAGPNLLRNAGAEDALVGGELPRWTELLGTAWSRRNASPVPFEGFAYFSAPGSSELGQEADLAGYGSVIAAGTQRFAYEAFLRSSSTSHGSRVALDFLDAAGAVLSTTLSTEITSSSAWQRVAGTPLAPAGAARLRLRLLCRSTSASQVCFFDNVSVRSTGTRVLWADDLATAESAGEARFGVQLSCPDSGEVTAGFATADGSAIAGLDYEARSGSLGFAAGETRTTVAVPLVQDDLAEPEEELHLDLGPVSGAPLARGRAIGEVVDDDGPPVELALCFDGSGSINAAEFALQRGGMAAALANPAVVPQNGSVRISIFQFDSAARVEIPPTLVTAENAAELAARVNAITQMGGGTNIPSCMVLVRNALAQAAPPALKRVLDVSTDGQSSGDLPGEADISTAAGIDVINAIAVGDGADIAGLNAMVRPQPAGGLEGFVVVASTFEQYQAAIAQKIQREVTPDIAVTKTDNRDSAVPGEATTYVITVRNVGAAPVAGLRVSEPVQRILGATFTPSAGSYDAASGTWSGLQLDGGHAVTLTVSGTIDPLATGTLTNTVTALPPEGTNDLDPTNNSATDTTQLVPAADVSIAKSHAGELFAGGQATYTLRVSNAGPSAAAGPIAVSDPLPAGLSFVSAAGSGWTCSAPSGTVSCQHAGPLVPGAALPDVTLVVAVGPQAVPAVTNTATVAAGTPDPDAADNTASDTAAVAVRSTIAVSDVTVNEGNAGTTDAVFTLTLSEPALAEVSVRYDTADGTATAGSAGAPGADYVAASGTVVIPAGGSSATVVVTVLGDLVDEVDETFRLLLSAPVNALIADGEGQGTIVDDDAIAVSKVDALLEDRDGNGVVTPGDVVGYTVTVASIASAPFSGLTFEDAVPANSTIVAGSVTTDSGTVQSESPVRVALGTLAPGGTATIRFAVVLDVPWPAGVGELVNQGRVLGLTSGAVLTDDPDRPGAEDPTVTAIANVPVLVATKRDALFEDRDGDTHASPGDLLRYTVEVRNTGIAPASTVVFQDVAPAYTSIVAGSVVTSAGTIESEDPVRVRLESVAPNAAVTIAFDVEIDWPVPPAVEEVSNQGTVTSAELPAVLTDDPDVPGRQDATVTPLVAAPRLAAAKVDQLAVDADGDGVASPGDTLGYTITIANSGNTAATNVALLDVIPEHTTVVAGSVVASAGDVTSESPVQVEADELAAGGQLTVTFQVRIVHPIEPSVVEVSNQARVWSAEIAEFLSDDPDVPGEANPTSTAVSASPVLTVAKTDVLYEDGNGDGFASPGEVVLYQLTIGNGGNTRATDVRLTDTVPVHTTLVAGTVQTSQGTINTESPIDVALGDIAVGGTATVSFRVRIDSPFPEGASTISNQASVSAAELAPVPSDDPETAEPRDATVTAVVIPIEVSVADASVAESAGTAAFPVVLSRASTRDVSVAYATTNGSAAAGADYTATTGTLIIPAGATSGQIVVPVLDDPIDEPDESFTLTLSSPVGIVIVDGEAAGTILDDDLPPVLTVADLSITEGNTGTTAAAFTFTLSAPSAFPISVDYSTAAGTATVDADFTVAGGSVSFAPGETGKQVTVNVLGDLLDEADETFRLLLADPVAVTLAQPHATATIVDDDAAPALSIADVTVEEGNAGTVAASFAVTLSAPSGREISVRFATADVEAIAGSDYAAATGTLVIPAGATTATIGVTVNGDVFDEPTERFEVRLSEPTNVELADAAGVGTILDDDGQPALSAGDVTVHEGDGDGFTSVDVPLTLSAASGFVVSADFSTADGTATQPQDYLSSADAVRIPAGSSTATVRLRVRQDLVDEVDETFLLRLSNAVNATLADAEGTITIVDDDEALASVGDVSVTEGHSGTTNAIFTIRLSTTSDREVRLDYATTNGTATAPADYQSTSGTAIFAAGEVEKTVTVPVVSDLVLESAEETFRLELSNAVNTAFADPVGVGTILDDELCPGLDLLANGNAEARATNGNPTGWTEAAGTDWKRVYRGTNPAAFQGLGYFVPGAFTPTTAKPAAELAQTVSLAPFAALIDGGDQRFLFQAAVRTGVGSADQVRVVVEYRNESGTVLDSYDSGALSSASAWRELVDLRLAPAGARSARVRLIATWGEGSTLESYFDAVSLRPLRIAGVTVDDLVTYEGHSGQHDANFMLRLACPYERDVEVAYATADVKAKAGLDYLATTGTTVLPAGTTSKPVPVPILGDTLYEGHEKFRLDLTLPPQEGDVVLLDPQGSGLILDDDFCARTPGYWKNHASNWPVDHLVLGGREYEKAQLLTMLTFNGTDAASNLAKHLIATKLNLLVGSEPSIVGAVEGADAFLVTYPPGSNPQGAKRDEAIAIKDVLDRYNNTRAAGCTEAAPLY